MSHTLCLHITSVTLMRPFQLDWLWPFIEIFYSLQKHQITNCSGYSFSQSRHFFASLKLWPHDFDARTKHSTHSYQIAMISYEIDNFFIFCGFAQGFGIHAKDEHKCLLTFTRGTDLYLFFLVRFDKEKNEEIFCFWCETYDPFNALHAKRNNKQFVAKC